MRFKLRTERHADFAELILRMVTDNQVVKIIARNDLEYTIDTPLWREAIWEYIVRIKGHSLMLRTLAPAVDYAGIEDPDIDFEYMAANS